MIILCSLSHTPSPVLHSSLPSSSFFPFSFGISFSYSIVDILTKFLPLSKGILWDEPSRSPYLNYVDGSGMIKNIT
jgi:hypothetical protein